MLSWLFGKFWDASPRFTSETVWNHVMEEDGIELIRVELDRIADAIEGIHYHICDCEDGEDSFLFPAEGCC